ncbi:hypothetical protein ACW9YV_14080 [Paraburkholderia strydomiana]|jgi:hypothetical protein|uniref:Uncharacterized protein n=1 Tax=Paraburkholderia caledonica TaxID=134536 RepID=A0ABU1KXA9_9BURK|nr:hypothetical protein [Paraburkholderia caledonica]MDR6375608.1 hypothetical protein [Paraburkholderia caledonica]
MKRVIETEPHAAHLETIARFVERAQRSAFAGAVLQYVIDRAKPEQSSATQLLEDR